MYRAIHPGGLFLLEIALKLTDLMYGIAYRNHRYGEDEYTLSFYTRKRDRDIALMDMDATAPASKKLTFEFRPIDLINKEKHGTS